MLCTQFLRGYVLVELGTRTCAERIDGIVYHGAERELGFFFVFAFFEQF